MDFNDPIANYDPKAKQPTPRAQPSRAKHTMYRYIVEKHSEGAIGTILLGRSAFNTGKLATLINQHAAAGYRMVFQVKEERRMLLFWSRESIIMTFEKPIS